MIMNRLNTLLESKFVINFGWLGLSELGIRLSRLLTAVVLARVLDPVTFGIAALVLTINELVHVFNRNGIGAKIVQCDDSDLHETLNTAYRLGFLICVSLFIIQCLLAYPLARYYQTPELVTMLQALALVYLMMPFGLVQSALVQRAEQLKKKAIIEGVQVGTDNMLTACLAFAGLGAWAIVLPKLLVAPIWVLGYRRAVNWKPTGAFWNMPGWQSILNFGRFFLGVELLKTARLNLDNLLIARFLGVEALGLYYFARNAGLGFSLSLISAMTSALYPNLCAVKNNSLELYDRFNRNIRRVTTIVIPLILLQAFLAPIYVPLVFGEQWNNAIPILMLLCLSATLRPLGESASTLLLVKNQVRTDFYIHGLLMTIFLIVIVVACQFSLTTVAISIVVFYTLTQSAFFIYARSQHLTKPRLMNAYTT